MVGTPEAFARSTVDREGEPGAAWLAALVTVRELGRTQPDTVIHGDLQELH
ncbi:hypothetical protein ACFPH6_45770 [Streptomyces xiangluensis]|uniref:Uncharacterized protein n=1 Tax=Streptomyces xiangluensis TaxID=2665720 RepID=A0ABV8Z8Q5_9ACTN